MKILVALTVLCLASFALCSHVVELTPDNFDQYVDGSKYVFVKFYAPWCGHCKNLAPEYEIVATAYENSEVVIAKFDADAHSEFARKHDIQGYPTLKFFPKSTTPEVYNGGRTAADLINYINGKVPAALKGKIPPPPPSDVVVLTPENFDSIVYDKSKNVFVEFYAPWCGHCKRLAPTWEKLATVFKSDENIVVAKLDADAHKDVAGKHGISGFPTLKFYSKENKDGEKYTGSRDLKELISFLNEKCGTERLEDGTLASKVGVVDELSTLIKTYMSQKSDEAAKSVTNAIAQLSGDQKKYVALYTKIFESIQSKEDYVNKEITRLERMMKGSLTKSKLDEFTIKMNILKSLQ